MTNEKKLIDDADGLNTLLNNLACINNLEIPVASMPAVAAHFKVASVMAEKVYSVDLGSDLFELGPVFTLPERSGDTHE